MVSSKPIAACLLLIFLSTGCTNKNGGGLYSKSDSSRAIQASVVEATNLQNAINSSPAYKFSDSELAMLQSEGIASSEDLKQLEPIK